MEDSMIIALYNARDESAILESDQKYGKFCFTIAENILHDRSDAEECLNDTWLRAWDAIPPAFPKVLRAFFGRITRNLAFDRYRRRNSEKRGGELTVALDELGECIADSSTVERAFEARVLGESINRFLEGLSERDRNVFLCRYYYTYSIADISKQFGMKENYLRNLLSRMRVKLKDHLGKEHLYE